MDPQRLIYIRPINEIHRNCAGPFFSDDNRALRNICKMHYIGFILIYLITGYTYIFSVFSLPDQIIPVC